MGVGRTSAAPSSSRIVRSSSRIEPSSCCVAVEGEFSTSTVTSLIRSTSLAKRATSLGWNINGSFWSLRYSGLSLRGLKGGLRLRGSVLV